MPRKDNILNLPGFSIKKSHGYNPMIFESHIEECLAVFIVLVRNYARKRAISAKLNTKLSVIGVPYYASKHISGSTPNKGAF